MDELDSALAYRRPGKVDALPWTEGRIAACGTLDRNFPESFCEAAEAHRQGGLRVEANETAFPDNLAGIG